MNSTQTEDPAEALVEAKADVNTKDHEGPRQSGDFIGDRSDKCPKLPVEPKADVRGCRRIKILAGSEKVSSFRTPLLRSLEMD